MDNKTFPLIKDLFLPIQGEDGSNGYFFFPKEYFGFSYENFRPNAEQKLLYLDFVVRRLDTNKTIHLIKTYIVTEQGSRTDVVLNDKEYSTFLKKKLDIDNELKDLEESYHLKQMSIITLQEQFNTADDKTPIQTEIQNLVNELKDIQDDIAKCFENRRNLKTVEPEYQYEFPYDEVIEWFNNEGILKSEFISDAKKIRFGNGFVGDYFE